MIHEKSYKNHLVYNISYKNAIIAKPLHFRYNKTDGFISVYDKSRYLVLFTTEKYDFIYNRIIYFKGVKSGITYVIWFI